MSECIFARLFLKHRLIRVAPTLSGPVLPFLDFFLFYQGKTSNLPRIFSHCWTHKILGKDRENTKISKEIPCLKLTKESRKTKEWKDRIRFGYGLGERFQRVPVFGSGGSSGRGVFCVSVQFNREGRFGFRFLKNGSDSFGSSPNLPFLCFFGFPCFVRCKEFAFLGIVFPSFPVI